MYIWECQQAFELQILCRAIFVFDACRRARSCVMRSYAYIYGFARITGSPKQRWNRTRLSSLTTGNHTICVWQTPFHNCTTPHTHTLSPRFSALKTRFSNNCSDNWSGAPSFNPRCCCSISLKPKNRQTLTFSVLINDCFTANTCVIDETICVMFVLYILYMRALGQHIVLRVWILYSTGLQFLLLDGTSFQKSASWPAASSRTMLLIVNLQQSHTRFLSMKHCIVSLLFSQ